MKLLIVESPAKAKTISKYLDGEYTVKASVGHIRDLPKSNLKAIDIEAGFVPHYEISPGKEKVVSEIAELAHRASEVLLATDPDREGEAIAWHIAETAGLKKPKRIVFHEITKEAIQEAVKHPRGIDQNLKTAQEARRVLDRLVGYDLSGLIWKKVRYGLSAGRVQSPALRIIMEREREIRAFVSHPFWIISADLGYAKGKPPVTFTCAEEPTDQKEMERILKAGRAHGWNVGEVEESQAKRSPRPPFITSTLQQAASSRLGMSPGRTMSVAQKLYEAGHITYMRTDSTTLSSQAISQITGIVESRWGKEYVNVRTFAAGKNAQEAHEAIRPSRFSVTEAGANDSERKVYRLIWQRAVASQMTDAQIMRTRVSAVIDGKETIPPFYANGSRVLFPGWLSADPDSRGEDVELPKLTNGQSLDLIDIRSEEKHTEPPPRYTEAGLVKELEKRDIGRPSTYASIIDTIVKRGYVEKDGKSLKPTETGDVVSTFLETHFGSYISDSFTAEMENELDEIAHGKRDYVKTLREFYTPFKKEVKSKDKLDKLTTLGEADPSLKCPKCGSGMVRKLSRMGTFLSCSRYPDCDGALTAEGKEIPKDEPIGNDPTTGLPIFVRIGRFGPYVQLGEKEAKKPKVRVRKTKAKKQTADGATDAATSAAATTTTAATVSTSTPEEGPKKVAKPRMASIPKSKDPSTVTVADALKYLSLPRVLGNHPTTGQPITASIGRFGPFIVHESDFRSLKQDDVYTITLERALEILKEPKKVGRGRGGWKKKKAGTPDTATEETSVATAESKT